MACLVTQPPSYCDPLHPSNGPQRLSCSSSQQDINEGYQSEDEVNAAVKILKGSDLIREECQLRIEDKENVVPCKASDATLNGVSSENPTEGGVQFGIPCVDPTNNLNHQVEEEYTGDEAQNIKVVRTCPKEEWFSKEPEEPTPTTEAIGTQSSKPEIKDLTIPLMKLRVVMNPFLKKMELEEDEYIFCKICDKLCIGECRRHKSLKWVREQTVVVKKEGLTKARSTLPCSLELRESSIPDAGLGVFAKERFDSDVIFGPYWGKKTFVGDVLANMDQSYMWDIIQEGRVTHVVDALDEEHSNWLRFVNCARNEDEQNLVAFQYRGEIYYRSYKTIEPGMEMLVWYGDRFACDLEILNGNVSNNKTDFPVKCQKCDTLCDGPWSLASHNKFRCQMNNEQHQWRCMHCDRSFKSHIGLNMHKNIHKGLKPYICKICGKAFYSPRSRHRHYSLHYFPEVHFCQCPSCGKTFSDRFNMRRHQIAVHGATKALKCPKCRKRFTLQGDLQMHQRHCCFSGKEFKCVWCGKHYSSKKSLRQHERTFHKDVGLKCGTCGKLFRKKENLLKHEFLHNNGTSFKCDLCGLCFFSGIGLANHHRIHSSKEQKREKLHECLKCKTKYTSHKGLRHHYRLYHPHLHVKSMSKTCRRVTNRCQICSLTFFNHYNLVRHTRELHPKKKIFKCLKCKMVFLDKCRLASHCASHTEERGAVKRVTPPKQDYRRLSSHQGPYDQGTAKRSRFPCSICKKRFSSISLMRMHKKTHFRSGPHKRYTCVRCTSSFTDLLSLSLHRKRCTAKTKVSTKEQDLLVNCFRCKQCDMPQLSYSSLCEHMEIHAKTSANDVPINVGRNTLDSSYALADPSACSLSKSSPSFAENKGFGCRVCNKSFISKESLRSHMSHHSRNASRSGDSSSESSVSNLSKSPPSFAERKGFSCSVCKKSFLSKESLASHKSHHTRNTLRSTGPLSESSVSHLSKSPPSFAENEGFSCSVCNKSFLSKESLASHKSHHTRNTLRSSGPLSESSVSHLSKSPPSFSENKGFSCRICNKSFLSKESLRSHKSHHSRNTLRSSGASSESSVGHLPKSLSSFTENKGLSCSVCNKSFLRKRSLYGHMSRHSRKTLSGAVSESSVSHLPKSPPSFAERKVFSCSVCNKSFISKGSLKSHMSHHSRNTLCSSGAVSESSVSHLSKSLPSFTGNEGFSCRVCNKSFLSKQSLNGHMSYHSRYTSRSSAASSSPSLNRLSKSSSSSSKNSGFSCSVRNKSLVSKKSLNAHTFHLIGFSSTPLVRGLRRSPRSLSECKGINCNLQFRKSCGRYKCWYCGKKLASRSSLRRHIKSHQAKFFNKVLVQGKALRVGGCTSCEDRFTICGKTVENGVQQCPQCTIRLSGSSSSLEKGTPNDRPVRKLQISRSGRQQKRLNCSRNVSGVEGRKMTLNAFRCHYCDKGFFTLSSRYKHMMIVHSKDLISGILKGEGSRIHAEPKGNQTVQYYDCSNLFSDGASLQKHLSTAHSKMSSKDGKSRLCAMLFEQCEYCGKRCSSQGSLDEHVKTCYVERSESSPVSSESTFLNNNTCHSTSCVQHPRDKSLQCDYCEKWFSNVSNRQRHVRNVHKKKRRSGARSSSGGSRYASEHSSHQRFAGDLQLSLDNSSVLSSVTNAKRACPSACSDVSLSGSKKLKRKHPNPFLPSVDNAISPSSRGGLRIRAFKCDYCVKRFFTLSSRFRHFMLAHSKYHTAGQPEAFDCMVESNQESVQSECDIVKSTFIKCRAKTNPRKLVKLPGGFSSEDAGSFSVVQLSSLVSDSFTSASAIPAIDSTTQMPYL